MPQTDDFFPASPRVIYGKSPLTQVICQLRYPSVLKIEGGTPVEFQESIRGVFPFFERANSGVAHQLPPELAQVFSHQITNNYIFKTEKKDAEINLAADAISLTSQSYKQWEEFKNLLRPPLQSLRDIYKPSFFNRIGLRYVNRISRESLDLVDLPWSKLLQPQILGELSVHAFEANVEEAKRALRVRGSGANGSFLLQHGLAKSSDAKTLVYIIDFDFYDDGKTACENADTLLDELHARAGRAFRWCITERLHEAMEPRRLDGDLDQEPT